MSSEAHTPHDGSLVPAGPEGLKRARRERRTRRQRRAALAVAAVCALVLGEALAHVLEAWPDDGSSSRSRPARAAAPSRVIEPGYEAPRPIDKPVVLDVSDAPSLEGSLAAAGAATRLEWSSSRPVDAQRAHGSPWLVVRRSKGSAGVSEEAGALRALLEALERARCDMEVPGAVSPGAAAQSAPSSLAGPSGGQTLRASGASGEGTSDQSPARTLAAGAGAEALRRAAAAALARERNINKVRVYPSRPAGYVNND